MMTGAVHNTRRLTLTLAGIDCGREEGVFERAIMSASDSAPAKRDLVIVGYGSLMSGSGLLAVRRGGKSRLVAKGAFPVLIRDVRRGLAKPSSHGDYLAMDIEPRTAAAPLSARIGSVARAGEIGGLGLVFDRASAPALARREEYSAEKFVELITLADRAELSLGEFLFELSARAGHRLLDYRRALFELLGYTSPGYIFHPLRFDEGFTAIIAIGSGFEGSGADEIVSRRRACGMAHLLSLSQALDGRRGCAVDRRAQIGYFVECLLGAWHGLDLSDLLGQLDFESELARELSVELDRASNAEQAYFLAATSLDERNYQERFCARQLQSISALLAPMADRLDGKVERG